VFAAALFSVKYVIDKSVFNTFDHRFETTLYQSSRFLNLVRRLSWKAKSRLCLFRRLSSKRCRLSFLVESNVEEIGKHRIFPIVGMICSILNALKIKVF
jgi:hypothetical protein